ncbi:DNA alkylation repair protein [Acidobacteria bacterium Mor1]|nr:DNA alkylation repair protein [Acidobacteria bacterium Mor1]
MGGVAEPDRVEVLQRFFQTGEGQYGEGDVFLGVRVPNVRKVARAHRDLSLVDLQSLLRSKFHEERQLALFILVIQFQRGDAALQKQIYDLYLANTERINNWDLVDGSAHQIVGGYLLERGRGPLRRLARSKSLWEQRIAIIATLTFIKQEEFEDTFELAEMLLLHPHDLIHKAVGWMLREVGNRDREAMETFLKPRHHTMPRTMLRYAIEKLPESRRREYLEGRVR